MPQRQMSLDAQRVPFIILGNDVPANNGVDLAMVFDASSRSGRMLTSTHALVLKAIGLRARSR